MSAPLVADVEDLTRVFMFFLNLLNKLSKRDIILSLFRNDFNSFNNTRAQYSILFII